MKRVLERFAFALATVACVYVTTFMMAVALPGNPFQQGQRRLPPETLMALRARYDMDNLWAYFWQFASGAIRLDFGPSFSYPDWTCGQIIAASLPVSMLVGLSAILLALWVGVPAGVIGAARRGAWPDHALSIAIVAVISIPSFVIGGLLLTVFSIHLRLFPIGGWGTLAHLPLPVVTLCLPFAAHIARLTRVSMIDVLATDVVRTALAKGASSRRALWGHALRVAILPVVSYIGPAAAQALTGSFVVERLYGIPGMGQHFVNAALNRDVGLLLSAVLVFSVFLVVFNLLIDAAYGLVDPRIRGAV